MRRQTHRDVPRAIVLMAALVLATLVLTACGDDAFESNDYYMTFLNSQPETKKVASLSGRPGAPTPDELKDEKEAYIVRGILQAGEAIDEIGQADVLQDEATTHFDNGDDDLAAQALDEAIKIRPSDPAYRHDRAIVALAQGEIEVAKAQWEAQDEIAKANGWTDDPWYWGQTLAETDAVLQMGMGGSLASDTGYGESATYSRASTVYLEAAEFAKAQGDAELAADYEDTSDVYRSMADDARYDTDD